MNILGIDAGLRRTGWGIVKKHNQRLSYVASGVIITKLSSDAEALGQIFDEIFSVIGQYQPHCCAIENTYVNKNPLSSLKLAQARAAAIVACAKHNLAPYEYPASTIKKIVAGKGNADKIQVNKMISLQLGAIKPRTHDESDAVAIAMCCALSRENFEKYN